MRLTYCAKTGRTMIQGFFNLYQDDALSNLGSMLDYAVGSCGEPLPSFYTRFLASGISAQMDACNPKYLCGMSGTELARAVAVRTGAPLKNAAPNIDIGSPEYWTGWTIGYLRWHLDIDFATLQRRGLPVEDLYARYDTLHEADPTKSLAFARKALEEFAQKDNPLRRARLNAGLTQRELAYLSNTTIRLIRAYEQGQLSLYNAGVGNILNICHVLGCSIKDILPAEPSC